jgi:hypothetical protein
MESISNTAETLDLSQYDTQGFCPNYPLLRHRYESLANLGCHEARADWIQYVGPAAEFGGCNPLNGNFTALVLPVCRPERLQLVAYILECKRTFLIITSSRLLMSTIDAFLHDNVVEVINTSSVGVPSTPSCGRMPTNTVQANHDGDEWSLGDQESRKAAVKEGRKQIQAKMMLGLTSTDKACAERVMEVWKTMLSTTLRDKSKDFATLEEYLDFRIIDTGAP